MPKIKMPKGAPSIDMTPMVDLAFLLVTFFMLSANFRSDDVTVSTPSSISDKEVPKKHMITVTIDENGRAYFGATDEGTREGMLKLMMKQHNLNLTKDQVEEFLSISSVGCPIQQLPQYIDASTNDRQKNFPGVPSDSTNNQLKEWIRAGQMAALKTGEDEYKSESEKTADKLDVKDFKPIFVLKVDGKAHYAQAKTAIDTFRDLNINNLNFVTSLEENPYNKQKPKP